MVLKIVLLLLAAYLLGSIPSAVWIGKIFYGIDVRQHGSGNAGATNTLRVLGVKAAIPVFIIDVAKGYLAVTLAALAGFESESPEVYNLKFALTAAVVIGHIYPIFAGFKGGKGVATIAGAVLGIYPPAVLLCLATFVVVLLATQYVSVASMTAGVSLPIYIIFIFHQTYVPLIVFCGVISLLLIFTHRKNIRNLINGTERKTYIWHKDGEKTK